MSATHQTSSGQSKGILYSVKVSILNYKTLGLYDTLNYVELQDVPVFRMSNSGHRA